MNIRRSVFVMVVVVFLLLSMVGMASANSQTWYLRGDTTGKPDGADYLMTKGSGSSTVHVYDIAIGGSKIWAPTYAVSVGQIDMGGTWTGNIRVYPNSAGSQDIKARVDIGILKDGTFTSKFSDENAWTGVPGGVHIDWAISLSRDPFELNNGEYLAVKFTNDGTSTTTVNVLCKPHPTNSPSYITYPFDDPDYPVPELSTMLLTSMGVLMLGGFVLYSRRRNNN